MFKWIKKLFNRKPKLNFVSFANAQTTMIIGEEVDNREEVMPIGIIHLLESKQEINAFNLAQKIHEVKDRIKFFEKTLKVSAPRELQQALDMLNARKKYKKNFKNFVWKTTSKEKINEMLEKYKLKHDTLDNFIYNLPDLAIKECSDFCKALESVTDKPAEFSLIAPPKFFKDPRMDPILLGKSPFGDFYYILCAWDKEVDIVHELLYGEKFDLK
jgi:hypothetical protein